MAETAIDGIGGERITAAAAPVKAKQPPRLSGRNGYSLFVTSMKLLLPALATGLVLLVVAWPQIIADHRGIGLDFSKIARDQAKTLDDLKRAGPGLVETAPDDLEDLRPDEAAIVRHVGPEAELRVGGAGGRGRRPRR